MEPIQIQLLSGAGTGRRTTYNETPVSFGRDINNTVVVEDEFASRQHGEIRFEQDKWVLANLSPNGTRLNRKLIKDKLAPIKTGDTISIGKTPAFNLTVLGTPDAVAAAEAPVEIDDEQKLTAKKMKLWIGIGLYMLIIVVVGVIVKMNMTERVKPAAKMPPVLTDETIAQEIRSGLTRDESTPKAQQLAIEADKLFPHRKESLKILFNVHFTYQEALAHSKKSEFADPQTQLNFQSARYDLIEAVKRKYKSACSKLRQNDFRSAASEFHEIIDF